MESVIERIRQAREHENKRRTDANVSEKTVDGCQVIMRFDPVGDVRVMPAIRAMLISSYMDAALTNESGGEQA